MMAGVAMTLSDNVIAVLIGLVVATAGFFGAHSTAAGWTGQAAPVGKAQASSLYNLFYYAGSSAIGWLGGVAFDARGWTAVAVTILVFAGIAALLAALLSARRLEIWLMPRRRTILSTRQEHSPSKRKG